MEQNSPNQLVRMDGQINQQMQQYQGHGGMSMIRQNSMDQNKGETDPTNCK